MNKPVWTGLVLLLCALLCLSGCAAQAALEDVETEAPTEDPKLLVSEYRLVAADGAELEILDQFPNLRKVDLSGSTCYEAIAAYQSSHPQVEVTYNVQIGEVTYSPEIVELSLEAGTFQPEELLERLAYLDCLEKLYLPQTTLSAEELAVLMEEYPEISLFYTVFLGEEELSGDTQQLDLSHLGTEQVEQICQVLPKLMQLSEVELMQEDGTSGYAMEDVKLLMSAAPDASFHYTFKLFGQSISTTDERVEFVKKKIGNNGVEQVRQALDILPQCTYFLLDSCGVDNEVMAQLRDDYPDTKIVWRVKCGVKSYLTDTTVVRCVETLNNKNSKQLKYCTDVVYLDIGHNYTLSDLSFVSYMPNLKVAIVGDCHTESVEPFAACKNLQYLEIVNCDYLKDVSPLANCTELRGVNMSNSMGIDDLSPFYGLEKLERLFLGKHDLPQEEIDAVRQALPNCWVTDQSENVAWIGFNYSVGWRLDDEKTLADWYKEIMEVFGYTRTI